VFAVTEKRSYLDHQESVASALAQVLVEVWDEVEQLQKMNINYIE